MTRQVDRLREAFAALDGGDAGPFAALFAPTAQWHGVPGIGVDGATPTWHDRREVVDLLAQHHRNGRRFEPVDFLEAGPHVAVELGWGGYKVFTFAADGEEIVHLQDCVDRDDALARLAG